MTLGDPPPLPGPKDPAYINYSEIENASVSWTSFRRTY